MKPDAFKSQLQGAVLMTYYEDIRGVHGASSCPKPKIVKRRFKDQDDAGTTPDEDASSEGAAAAASAGAAAAGAAAAGGAAAAPAEGAVAAAAPAGGEAAEVAAPAPALLERGYGVARSLRMADAD